MVSIRTDIPTAWDERATLTTVLDYARATVHAKCAGVGAADARRAPVPTSPLLTLSGLVSHLHWVEYVWFQVTFLGEDDHGPWTAEDPDAEWRTTDPLDDLLAAYEAQCARYRELVARHDLDRRAVRTRPRDAEPVTLRWILAHLVEETARHNGHLDIVRELMDGTRGD